MKTLESVFVLAQIQLPTQLKGPLQTGLGIVMAVAFIYAVIQVIGGVVTLRRGDPDGKMGIVAGILIAGAVAIVAAAFSAFNLGAASLN